MSSPGLLHKLKTGVRVLYEWHGPWFPFVAVHRAWSYCAWKLFGPFTFEFAGKARPFFFHPYSLNSERAVEVALARDFLRGQTGTVLEIGNVLAHYFRSSHDVVDKYERAPGVINEDVVTYSPGKKYDRIVTISTLEHVGWDEQPREPEKVMIAFERLKGLLNREGQMLVTLPLGYNPHVDDLLRQGKFSFSETRYLKRVSARNDWKEVSSEVAFQVKYGTPFRCANAVVVGTVDMKLATAG